MPLQIIARRLGLTALILVLLVTTAAAGEPLASWNQPLRGKILDFATQAANPASPGFVPAPQRVAAFDLDGTLITERPNFFVLEVALARLKAICPAFAEQGAQEAELCRAAGRQDRRFIRKHLDQVLSLPFKGMSFAQYRQLVSRVWNQGLHPQHQRPFRDTVYRPMRELVALLQAKGFTVYLNSGADELSLMAICADLGVEPAHVIGTRYQAEPREREGRVELVRTGGLDLKFLNLGANKALNMYFAAGRAPVLAAGNSTGDSWLLRMAGANPLTHLVLVVDHDDPKEAVYTRPELLELARQKGWDVVSMRRDWLNLFE
ncbi:HAD family hydrolase [Desulfoferula mesophila]|uniref:Haloacid dehalogenase n=1 Tax=Desulfoferula mesophila TaxID=3058419 RepID=A0AAU9EIF6_9BACT|nr:haloacid dehalogenase [Desulfoferula mesophilus]